MKSTTTSSLLLVTLFLSTIISQIFNGGATKTQSDTLGQFYKLKKNSNIDKSHFDASIFDDLHTASSKKNVISNQEDLKTNDRIHKLPGQPLVKFEQYGGYITINEFAGRAFYYYFVEAQHSKKSLPLLLWLNGGPGCSSLAYGAFQEIGPFRVNSDGKTLHINNFAWNHAANVLFVESPAGVGFSYSNTSSDVKIGGDRKTANDNYRFIINWLERFPEYKDRDFYIAGESYAGHYVPQLAHTILYHNKKANKNIINLKGILIGNAVINDETDTRGMYEYFASHALISDEVEAEIQKQCKFTIPESEETDECKMAGSIADYDAHSHIDIYAIYAPLCHNTNLTSLAVQRTSASRTQPNESKQTPNLENKRTFSFQILCLFSIPSILVSATSRIIEDLRKFWLYYAEFMWIVLFILLISERKVSLVCLVAMKEVAVLYLLFLDSVANSVVFRWLIALDTRPIVLPLLAIGTCLALILTGAGIQLLITLALTFPIVLAHAVLCVAEDFSLDDEIDQESVPLVHTV